MNSIELQNIQTQFGTIENKTMEDYFTHLNLMTNIDVDTLKSEFKNNYPDETNWSF